MTFDQRSICIIDPREDHKHTTLCNNDVIYRDEYFHDINSAFIFALEDGKPKLCDLCVGLINETLYDATAEEE